MISSLKKFIRYKIHLMLYSILPQKIQSCQEKTIKSIVFLRPGKLGDLLVATPLFHALKSEMPDIKVTVVCSPYNSIIVKHSPEVDTVKVVNFHSLFSVISLVRWICQNKIDLMIDLTPEFSRTSTLISYFLRMAKVQTAGMHKGEFSRFFDINTDTQGQHIIDRNRILLETALQHSFRSDDFRPLIYSTEQQVCAAAEFKRELGDQKLKLGINLSAGQHERQWSYGNYHKLVNMITEFFGEEVAVILFSHGEQRLWAEKIADQVKVNIAPSTDILTLAEILKFCKILFTPDTVFLHLASAKKIPVVALYCIAGENFIRWKAYGVLSKELIAGDSGDVNEITPAEAFDNIKEMINILKGNKE